MPFLLSLSNRESSPPAFLYKILKALRRRARVIFLGNIFLLVVAADMGYDILGVGLFHLTGYSIYYPPFFLILLTILWLKAYQATRLFPYCRRLDRSCGLKDRLAHFLIYRHDFSVSDEIKSAQAHECLAHIDFQVLKKESRFKPLAPLLIIAVFSVVLWFILWRYSYTPRNFVFRQGRQVAYNLQRLLPEGHLPIDVASLAEEEAGAFPEKQRELKSKDTDSKTGERLDNLPEKDTAPPSSDPSEDDSETNDADRDQGESEKPSQETSDQESVSSETETGRGSSSKKNEEQHKIKSQEITTKPSPPTVPPPHSEFPPDTALGAGGGPFLPPIPPLRVVEGFPEDDFFFDPDTYYVVPETYPAKYRSQILSYYRRLLELKGDRHGP